MNRREFSTLAAATATATLIPETGASQQATVPPAGTQSVAPQATAVGEAVRRLYRRALVLDANCAPPLPDRLPVPQADLDLVRNSGISVIKLSLGGINSDFAHTVKAIGQVEQLIEVHPAYFMGVRVPGDMARAKKEGKLGIILSFESVEMLGGQISSLELFRDLGVRVMQLSYNRKSPFAAVVMEPTGGGLTPLGRDAVKEMNRLGIAVDLSHANAATTTPDVPRPWRAMSRHCSLPGHRSSGCIWCDTAG